MTAMTVRNRKKQTDLLYIQWLYEYFHCHAIQLVARPHIEYYRILSPLPLNTQVFLSRRQPQFSKANGDCC